MSVTKFWWRALPLTALAAITMLACPAVAGNYAFTVDVTVSAKTAALLAAKKEKIKVAAYYWGDPLPAYEKKADEMGQINLGEEDVTIPGTGGRANIAGARLRTAHIGWVKEPQILINVFTARLGDKNNLIDCGIFEGTFPEAQAHPIAISCKLIGEP
jgi:hypothetical protein